MTFKQLEKEIIQGAAHVAAERAMLDAMEGKPRLLVGESAPPFERFAGEEPEEAAIRRAHELRRWHTSGLE